MSSKPLKIIVYLILAAVAGLAGHVVIGFSFFSYKDKTLIAGCEQEFCVEQSKAQVHALFDGKFSFDSGAMVPYDPAIKPSPYKSNNYANTIGEMIATDRWTIVYNEKRG